MKFKRFKAFLLGTGILAVAVLMVVVSAALKPETQKEETKKPPLIVRTADAELKEQKVFATFQGEVRAKTNIELVTQVTGKVMSVADKFIEGGQFKAGEVLIQIDDADYLVALKAAEASVASAQVDLEVEQATAANRAKEWRDLQRKPIEQANPLLLNKPQIDRAKARLVAANAELGAAKLNYERTKISAPFDGRIMSKSAELGQFMSRGGSIGRVFATDTMEVRIPMTDVQVSELGLTLGYSAQQEGSAGLPATVSAIFGDQKRVWAGAVKSVDASIDNQTRLLFATVVVDKPFEQIGDNGVPLVPGLFVDVELVSPQKVAGLELPRTALRNGNQVYVYDNDELELKAVKVVYTSQDKVIVSQEESDIAVGEKIITSSVPGAYQGMPVKLTVSERVDVVADAVVDDQVSDDINDALVPAADDETALPDTESAESLPQDAIEQSNDVSPVDQSQKDQDTGVSNQLNSASTAADKG